MCRGFLGSWVDGCFDLAEFLAHLIKGRVGYGFFMGFFYRGRILSCCLQHICEGRFVQVFLLTHYRDLRGFFGPKRVADLDPHRFVEFLPAEPCLPTGGCW